MKQLSSLILKEFKYVIKTNRIWALITTTIFFGFIDPIILKALPSLLKDQLGGMDISQLITMNETAAIQSFINNQMEVTTVVVILVFAGQLANELRKNWILIPYHAHPKKWKYALSKFIANGLLMLPLTLMSTGIAIIYSGLLFEGVYFGFGTWLIISLGLWTHFLLAIGIVLLFDALLLPLGVTIGLSLLMMFGLGPIMGIMDITYPDSKIVNYIMTVPDNLGNYPIALVQGFVVIGVLLLLTTLVFQQVKLRRNW